jgi:hypothetical protein
MFLKRGQKLTFDLVLGWMNREHHRVELAECFPFDYSYTLIGVQMLEFCLSQGLGEKTATATRVLQCRPSFLAQSVHSLSQPWSGRVPSASPSSDHAKGEERERRRGEKEKRPRA